MKKSILIVVLYHAYELFDSALEKKITVFLVRCQVRAPYFLSSPFPVTNNCFETEFKAVDSVLLKVRKEAPTYT